MKNPTEVWVVQALDRAPRPQAPIRFYPFTNPSKIDAAHECRAGVGVGATMPLPRSVAVQFQLVYHPLQAFVHVVALGGDGG